MNSARDPVDCPSSTENTPRDMFDDLMTLKEIVVLVAKTGGESLGLSSESLPW